MIIHTKLRNGCIIYLLLYAVSENYLEKQGGVLSKGVEPFVLSDPKMNFGKNCARLNELFEQLLYTAT